MSRKFVVTEKDREAIAKRITDVILAHNYESFAAFAREYGVPKTTLQNWKKKGNINVAFLIQFSKDFHKDLRWLIIGPPYPEGEKLKKNE